MGDQQGRDEKGPSAPPPATSPPSAPPSMAPYGGNALAAGGAALQPAAASHLRVAPTGTDAAAAPAPAAPRSRIDLLRELVGLPPRVAKPDHTQDLRDQKLDLLRQLRAEISDIQALLRKVRDGQASLANYAGYIDQNRAEIEELFKVIETVLPDGDVAEGDNVRHLRNQWQMLTNSPIIAAPRSPLEAADQVRELAICDQLCREIVAQVGHLTVPARLNEWLQDGWNGYLLPFHDLFADELPEADDRNRLLQMLAAAPGIVKGGIVEPSSGLIFPYHHRWYTRTFVCLLLAACYAAATASMWFLGDKGRGLVTEPSMQLLINWLLVVAGVITHYAVDRSKSGRAGASTSIPLGHPLHAIDARAGVVLLKLMLMMVGFFGLIFLDPSGPHGHLDFFLVGYSLDSFVGIVSNQLDQRAAARGAQLAKVAA